MTRLERYTVLILLIFSLFHSFYYGYSDILPKTLLYFAAVSPTILMIVLVAFNDGFKNAPVFLVLFLLTLVTSFLFFTAQNTVGDTLTNLNIFIQILNGYLLASKGRVVFEDFFVRYVPILGLVLFPLLLSDAINTSYDEVLLRSKTWSGSFFLTPLYAMAPISLLWSIEIKYTIMQWIFLICSIVFYLFFLKRVIVVDILLLLFINVVFGSVSFRKILLLFTFLVLFGTFVVAKYVNVEFLIDFLDNRMSARALADNGRDREVFDFLSQTSVVEMIFGVGIDGHNWFLGEKSQSLHSGWFNLIYKYGLLFALYVFGVLIVRIFWQNSSKLVKGILTFFLVKFVFTNSYYISPELSLFSFCLFYREEH